MASSASENLCSTYCAMPDHSHRNSGKRSTEVGMGCSCNRQFGLIAPRIMTVQIQKSFPPRDHCLLTRNLRQRKGTERKSCLVHLHPFKWLLASLGRDRNSVPRIVNLIRKSLFRVVPVCLSRSSCLPRLKLPCSQPDIWGKEITTFSATCWLLGLSSTLGWETKL